MIRPNFFIVGAPKSGTTSMHQYLSQHPEVFMSAHKEPHFFGSDLDRPKRWQLTEAQYLRLFAEARGYPVIGESSVFYLHSRKAAEEIYAYQPRARILVMLRNPVDMIYSYHSQRVFGGVEDIEDFEAALAAERDRKLGRRLPPHLGLRQGLFYRDLGRYAEQLERYFLCFPRSQIRVVLYDDFAHDTRRAYSETLAFLGVADDLEPDFPVRNPNKVVRSRKVRDLVNYPPSWVRAAARLFLPTTRLRSDVGSFLRHLNSEVTRRPPMSHKLRRLLQEEFTDDVRRLESLLGRDLSAWINSDPPTLLE